MHFLKIVSYIFLNIKLILKSLFLEMAWIESQECCIREGPGLSPAQTPPEKDSYVKRTPWLGTLSSSPSNVSGKAGVKFSLNSIRMLVMRQ